MGDGAAVNAPTVTGTPADDDIASVALPTTPKFDPTKITSPTLSGTLVAPGSGYER